MIFDMTVTVLGNANPGTAIYLRPLVLTGAALAAAPATGVQSGNAAHQASITTTVTGSRVVGAIIDNGSAAAFTAAAGTTILDSIPAVNGAGCYGSCETTAATGTPGATTAGSTTAGSTGGVALLEVLASGTVTTDPSTPAAIVNENTAAATVTLNPPDGALLCALVAAQGDHINTTTVQVTGGGLHWTEQIAAASAANGYAGVWTAQLPAARPYLGAVMKSAAVIAGQMGITPPDFPVSGAIIAALASELVTAAVLTDAQVTTALNAAVAGTYPPYPGYLPRVAVLVNLLPYNAQSLETDGTAWTAGANTAYAWATAGSWNVLQSAVTPATSSGAASAAVTYGTNLTAGTKLVAAVAFSPVSGTPSCATVKDAAGNSFVKLAARTYPGSRGEVSLWAIDTPAGDAGAKPAITATLTGSTAEISLLAQEVSGLAPGATLAAMIDGTPGTGRGTGGGSTGSPSYGSMAAGEYLLSVFGDNGGPQTWAKPPGYTADPNSVNTSAYSDLAVSWVPSAGGTETGPYALSGTGTDWGVIIAAFKSGAAAALDGTHSGKITATASGVCSATPAATGIAAIPAGTADYTGSYWLYTTTAGLYATAAMDWYTGAVYVSTVTGTATPLTANAWTQVTVTGTSPSAATRIRLYPAFTATAGAQAAWFDQVLIVAN